MRQVIYAVAILLLSPFSAPAQQTASTLAFPDPNAQALYNAEPATYKSAEPYAAQWSQVNEKDVVWRKRVLRTIDVSEASNRLLTRVPENGLSKALITAVQAGEMKVYGNQDDRFTRALALEEFSIIAEGGMASPSSPTRYLVKEDWIYLSDGRGLVGRTIGIAPLAQGTAGQPLFWFYYPELRSLLSQQTMDAAGAGVSNLDEWFEGRHYASTVTKVSDSNYSSAVERNK